MYSTGYISKERRENLEISVWALQHKSILKVLEEVLRGGDIQKPKVITENKLCADGLKIRKTSLQGSFPNS